jgi:putative dimethyl sulfoxide reductase chaperone
MQQVTGELTELQAHAAINSLLARAMNYPDAALVALLTSGEFSHALGADLESLGHKDIREAIETLTAAYKNKPDKAEGLLDLERDYTRMFFASKPRIAYLFESVYREGRLLQESTFDIARLYREAGLVLNEDFALPPDHIAVELEFLSFLFFKEIQGLAERKEDTVEYARELRQMLLDQHLKQFALNIAERLGQHARCPLYQTTALVLRTYFR